MTLENYINIRNMLQLKLCIKDYVIACCQNQNEPTMITKKWLYSFSLFTLIEVTEGCVIDWVIFN